MITQEYLKSVLHYEPITGAWTWKISRRGMKPYQQAGSISVYGYRTIKIDKKQYRGSRLAWFYMKGEWPNQIDHINNISDDDRWENLREVTKQQNQQNRGKQKINTSGYKGVYWHNKNKKWYAQIGINRKNIHLGFFDDLKEAALAYNYAASQHFGPYARLNADV
jgi:hypothetical protein